MKIHGGLSLYLLLFCLLVDNKCSNLLIIGGLFHQGGLIKVWVSPWTLSCFSEGFETQNMSSDVLSWANILSFSSWRCLPASPPQEAHINGTTLWSDTTGHQLSAGGWMAEFGHVVKRENLSGRIQVETRSDHFAHLNLLFVKGFELSTLKP